MASFLSSMLLRRALVLVAIVMVGPATIHVPAVGQAVPKSPGQRLILLDGSAVPFDSLAISDGKLSGSGVPANLTLDDLRRIELIAAAAPIVNPSVVVELRGGGRLFAGGITIGDDKCHIDWSAGDPLSLPVDLIRAVRFQATNKSADFDKAL